MNKAKYTQETINDIENFFQSQFNQTSVKQSLSGDRMGQLYLSYKNLGKKEREMLEEFSITTIGKPFKNVQTAINTKVRNGKLTLDFGGETEPTKEPIVKSTSIIVKCSRLVRDNKMSYAELCEIMENLYP